MIGTLRTHARSHEADAAAQVLGVDGAVLSCGGGNVLGKSGRGTWNIEDHPVQNVVSLLLKRDIGIVQDQREADRSGRHVRPIQLRRDRVRIGLVYLFGMIPPSSKSGEVRVKPGPGGRPPALGCAKAALWLTKPSPATKKIVAPPVSIFMSFSSLECISISRRWWEVGGRKLLHEGLKGV